MIALRAASASNVEEFRLIRFHSFGDLQTQVGEGDAHRIKVMVEKFLLGSETKFEMEYTPLATTSLDG